MFTELYREEKRKETEVARRIKGKSKGARQIQPVISSLSVLHCPEHTKRFTERFNKDLEEILKSQYTHVYLWWIHFDIWQN